MASAAGITLDYHIADVLDLAVPSGPAAPGGPLHQAFHGVVMEMGILHYFVDLLPLLAVVSSMLRPGGRFLLREFHPISTKLINSRGR